MEMLYRNLPSLIISCLLPTDSNGNIITASWRYKSHPLLDIKCTQCDPGYMWDEECNDCVPDCFPQFLSITENLIQSLQT